MNSVNPKKRNTITRSKLRIEPLDEQSLEPASFKQSLVRHRKPFSSLTVSFVTHLVLILLLVLIVYRNPAPPSISLEARLESEPNIERSGESNRPVIEIEVDSDAPSSVEMEAESIARQSEPKSALAENPLDVLEVVIDSNPADPTSDQSASTIPAAPKKTLPTGGGLSGRQPNMRNRLVEMGGGTPDSESAVAKGLKWILEHQQDDGSWRLHHHKGKCDGRCPNEGTAESTTAATGLALMALLGAGYTHHSGPYQQPIQNGIDYLLSQIRYTSHGGILADGPKRMYAQAIATIALAEAWNMTGDSQLSEPVEACRRYIVAAQHSSGSWGYNAGSRGDITVTGWQLMALKSCQMAGSPTEPKTWLKAQSFLKTLSGSNGSFGYRSEGDGNMTTTSIGLLSHMVLGMHKEHTTLEMGSNVIAAEGYSKTNVYYNYYATQVLHHLQTQDWQQWNSRIREYLVATQAAGQGHADGSWYFPDQHGQVGGRLYTTAMCVMTLEVYYRYLPFYRNDALKAQLLEIEDLRR